MLELRFPAGSRPVETSEDAADNLKDLDQRRRAVLMVFADRIVQGATADEIAEHFDAHHNSTSPRVSELLGIGLLERADGKQGRPRERRATRDGGTAFVHRITRAGLSALELPGGIKLPKQPTMETKP